jgi:hypothetical protein
VMELLTCGGLIGKRIGKLVNGKCLSHGIQKKIFLPRLHSDQGYYYSKNAVHCLCGAHHKKIIAMHGIICLSC